MHYHHNRSTQCGQTSGFPSLNLRPLLSGSLLAGSPVSPFTYSGGMFIPQQILRHEHPKYVDEWLELKHILEDKVCFYW